MIIRQDGTYETREDKPNENWYKDEQNYIIDESTEEGQTMVKLYVENWPFVDFEHDDEFVTKVIVLDKPIRPPEVEGKIIELVKNEQGEWEYIYADIPLTKEQELELKIAQSNAELIELMMSLQGGV